LGTAGDDSIQRGKPLLAYFSPFSLGCVELGTVPKLARAEVLSNFTNPMFDVVSVQMNWAPLHADTP
jgi:hypothetical protein